MSTAAPTMSHPRLMITSMMLENFKSYAGVQEIGPFHKRFSSIVGPNGSGKSNVIDALLFVFGKKAKQLRLNKVSELIHKSSRYPDLEFTKVNVKFQMIIDDEASEDYFDVVKNSGFTITRIAYTDNSSKYLVDGKSSSFTAVGTLLSGYGIDLDNNRFLILQGEVEQIAMMKPKGANEHDEGLLEYLEDIIGSNRYIPEIEEKSKLLEGLNEQRTERVNRCNLAERERDNLSGQKEEAETYLNTERQIHRKKHTYYQSQKGIIEQRSEECGQELETLTVRLEEERRKSAENDAEIERMKSLYEETNAEYKVIETELLAKTAEWDACERRDVKLQEDKKHIKEQLKKSQAVVAKELKKEEEKLREAEEAKLAATEASKAAEEAQAKKAHEEAVLDEILQGLQEATKDLRGKLEVAQADIAEAERSVAGLETEKENVCMSATLLRSRVDNAVKSIAALEEKRNRLLQEQSEVDAAANADIAAKAGIEKSIEQLLVEIDRIDADEKRIRASIRELILRHEDAKAMLSAQSSQAGQGSIIASILKAAQPGGKLAKAGVRGRLGDLGTVDPLYDVAISTACAFLDYIVVDTAEGGQACIEYLKQMNIGRASFIVLEQMMQWTSPMNRAIVLPANTHRLFDLITTASPDLRPAFYFAFKDTLFAPDLDAAVAVAYSEGDKKIWRVVTADGNLIDNSGSMSGGGSAKRSGAMLLTGQTARPADKISSKSISIADVQALKDELDQLNSQLMKCRETRMKAEIDLGAAQDAAKAIGQRAAKTQLSQRHIEEQFHDCTERIEALQKEASFTEAEEQESRSLQQKLDAVEKSIVAAAPQLGQCKSAVASLQRKILDVGGPRMASTQQKLEILTKKYDTAAAALSAKQVEETNCRKQATKAQGAREKAEAEVSSAREKLAAIEAEFAAMEAEATRVMAALSEVEEKKTQQEAILVKTKSKFDLLKEALKKSKSAEMDWKNKVDSKSVQMKHFIEEIRQYDEKLEKVEQEYSKLLFDFNSSVTDILNTPVPAAPPCQSDSAIVTFDESNFATLQSEWLGPHSEQELQPLSKELLKAYMADDDFVKNLRQEIAGLEAELQKLESVVNMKALYEYIRKDRNYRARLMELEAITAVRNQMRSQYENVRKLRLEEFMSGFGIITLKLKEMYQMITLGGDAELELVDSLDPFSEGIVFSVRPPKKSWKNISNLSGGEKTLSSLALVFALHHFKPTPLYVMDEIDAALDFKNVSIVANYIKERTKNAQFVIISLRNNMFELADRLVGIYKTNDATKSVTINPKLFGHSTHMPEQENRQSTLGEGKRALLSEKLSTTESASVVVNALGPASRPVLSDHTNAPIQE